VQGLPDRANLSGAGFITNEALEQQTASLAGAITPNGRKRYEDWLKDRKCHMEDASPLLWSPFAWSKTNFGEP